MYYEEKCVNGQWFRRGTPDGEWVPFSKNDKSAEIAALQATLTEAEARAKRVTINELRADIETKKSIADQWRKRAEAAEIWLAESEAQRAVLVAALEEVRAWREPMDPTIEKELAMLHEEMKPCPECKAMANHPVSRGVCAGGKYRHYERTRALYEKRDRISDNTTPHQVRCIAEKALANQPPSDLVAVVKAAEQVINVDALPPKGVGGELTWMRSIVSTDEDEAEAFGRFGRLDRALDTLFQNQPGWRAMIDRGDA